MRATIAMSSREICAHKLAAMAIVATTARRLLGATRAISRRHLSTAGPLHLYCDALSGGRLRSDASQASAVYALQASHLGDGPGASGVYLHGAVGTGKSLLMELAHRAGAGAARPRRQHWHELMIDVHARLHALQQARPRRVVLTEQGQRVFKYDDADDDVDHAAPLDAVVRAIAAETQLLCLDEVQVTDVADALVLRRLFEKLFAAGVRCVFTSNRAPEALYDRGLNRRYFLPFVELIRARCAVVRVGGAGADALDYRSLLAGGAAGDLFSGAGAEARLSDAWGAWLREHEAGAAAAAERSRRRRARRRRRSPWRSGASSRSRSAAARARDFAELCAQDVRGRALGAADYLALASRVSALFLADIPVLGPTSRNEARRFVHLVDALYENNVRLYASAAAPPAELFAPLLAAAASTEAVDGAEVAVDGGLAARACVVESGGAVDGGAPSFAVAPVGGAYERDGELSSFFTARTRASRADGR